MMKCCIVGFLLVHLGVAVLTGIIATSHLDLPVRAAFYHFCYVPEVVFGYDALLPKTVVQNASCKTVCSPALYNPKVSIL